MRSWSSSFFSFFLTKGFPFRSFTKSFVSRRPVETSSINVPTPFGLASWVRAIATLAGFPTGVVGSWDPPSTVSFRHLQISLREGVGSVPAAQTQANSNAKLVVGIIGKCPMMAFKDLEPHHHVAEFTLGSTHTYDISNVDGYNLAMTMRPQSPSNPNSYWCTTPGCTSDLNAICPEELKVYGSSGVVACKSACEKFNTDEYCCRGAHNRPETCKSEDWPVNYPAIFKQACPTAYSYAYDDHTSTYSCQNTGYDIIFCDGSYQWWW